MMLDKLQNSTDTRLAIGLGLLKSVPAVPLLRRGLKRFFPLSPAIRIAFALALWRIDGDAAMVDVIVKALKARSTDTTTRGDGVRALAQIPTEASRAALFDLLRSDPEYLVRYHSFAGLLRLYGYDRAEADREVGAAAPHIARMLKDPAAGERVLATLATLIRGRSLGNAP
jgi:HEAT repeat protein